MKTLALISSAFLLSVTTAVTAQEQPKPLRQAHAHNDYEHPRPLLDALEHGFCSVEADIHLVDGLLLVAHDRHQVKPERTLQMLYLDPLRQRVQHHGGRVYRDGPPLILLIDVKSEAAATYAVLRQLLLAYTNMLSRFTADTIQTKAVTVIISGNRARDQMAAEPVRYAGVDGRPGDLDGTAPAALIPLVSEDWKRLFAWRGIGPFALAERQRLRALVEKAHQQQRLIRFWGTADRPAVWKELAEAGVDLLNADDLKGLQQFLMQ